MTKKLVQHGNSAALIIDKPILELLNLTMETPLEISTDGTNIVISPSRAGGEESFSASLEKINDRFGSTLERLGE
jgi:antitoxin component of MazEF toxin-antitoxin module